MLIDLAVAVKLWLQRFLPCVKLLRGQSKIPREVGQPRESKRGNKVSSYMQSEHSCFIGIHLLPAVSTHPVPTEISGESSASCEGPSAHLGDSRGSHIPSWQRAGGEITADQGDIQQAWNTVPASLAQRRNWSLSLSSLALSCAPPHSQVDHVSGEPAVRVLFITISQGPRRVLALKQ